MEKLDILNIYDLIRESSIFNSEKEREDIIKEIDIEKVPSGIRYFLPLYYFDFKYKDFKIENDIYLRIIYDKLQKEITIYDVVYQKILTKNEKKIMEEKTLKKTETENTFLIDDIDEDKEKINVETIYKLTSLLENRFIENLKNKTKNKIDLEEKYKKDGILEELRSKFETEKYYDTNTKKVIIYAKRLDKRAESFVSNNRDNLNKYHNIKNKEYIIPIDIWADKDTENIEGKILKIYEIYMKNFNFDIYKNKKGEYDPDTYDYVWEDITLLSENLEKKLNYHNPSSKTEFIIGNDSKGNYGVFLIIKEKDILKFIEY